MLGIGAYLIPLIVASRVLVGLLLKWIIEMWLSEREASITAFSAMCGGIPGSFLLDLDFTDYATAEKIGSSLGLALFWWILFKRKGPAV